MRTGGVLFPALLLVFASAALQASASEDIYWEGEDASNEFLEVRSSEELRQPVKRAAWNFFDLLSKNPSSTTPPTIQDVNTDIPDETEDTYEGEGSGYQPLQPPTEKTLRVSFVVNEPYRLEYSNRDSTPFQLFSKSLATAVDNVLESVPGKQKANLVRIQSLTNDDVTCNVTLDITTIGYEDTRHIAKTLETYITKQRYLGHVVVNDKSFIATIDPDICNAGEISCEDGRGCFYDKARCDGISDCSDKSDEADCPNASWDPQTEDTSSLYEFDIEQSTENVPLYECAPGEVRCDLTRCIMKSKLCDGISDCHDSSDESNCKNKTCGADDFHCRSGECIPISARCNQVEDCSSKDDEINCDCNIDDFQCRGDRSCIELRKRCDGFKHCIDGSDEEECLSGESVIDRETCGSDQITCPSEGSDEFCATRCDNNKECLNGEDETDCEEECQHFCDGNCLDADKICDGEPDCIDNSDETSCVACDGPTDFRCNDGTCLNIAQRCNSHPECPDQSDEANCDKIMNPNLPSETCNVREFTCNDGSCIGKQLHCDRHDDCNDNSDEINCLYDTGCDPDQFTCSSGQCIPRSSYCDSTPDCYDKSDEPSTCYYNDPYTTGYPYTRPTTDYLPPPYTTQPPRRNDVPVYPNTPNPILTSTSGYERGHPGDPTGLKLTTYPNKEAVRMVQYPSGGDVVLQCRDEGLLRAPVTWVREGGRPLKPGSVDRKGRLEMYKVSVQDSGTYLCIARGYMGYPGSEVKVQLTVSPHVATANRPFPECKAHEATCSNGQCIAKSNICNGVIDCADHSDEDSCHQNGICEPNQYECSNHKCILKTWLCDAENDCGDNSDEDDCGNGNFDAQSGVCMSKEFVCKNITQCIPKSFHCDGFSDCLDLSDEIGCLPIRITKPPTPTEARLQPGDTLTLECNAYGVPTPLISWRLNWGHVPAKCNSTSENGNGVLVCPDMQHEDSGAYSCEALNTRASLLVTKDAIVFVEKRDICPSGYFNSEARTEGDCIRCFCFGESISCKSADLFTYNMPTPLGDGGTRLLGIKIDPYFRDVSVDPHPITNQYHYARNEKLRNSATITKLIKYDSVIKSDSKPYLALPETYNGNQLKSYGGSITYRFNPHIPGNNYENAIIIKGKYETLIYVNNPSLREPLIQARLVPGLWKKVSPRGLESASREDIMMTLDDVELVLLRAEANNGGGVTITDFKMESAQLFNVQLGSASLVEECSCPKGYEGLSCQKCASGYTRQNSGNPWLGHCVAEVQTCPSRMFNPGDGQGCLPCPCPFECAIASSGEVVCDCPLGYEGAHCQSCSPGYTGNPLIRGDVCRPEVSSNCNSVGTLNNQAPNECQCKANVQGRFCDQCKQDSFFLSEDFGNGCARCFCSGVTTNCKSSNLRRVTLHTSLKIPQVADQVKIYITELPNSNGNSYKAPRETYIQQIVTDGSVTIYNLAEQSSVYYWSLPADFAGDKVTSYGGNLRYSVSYDGQGTIASKVPDVQLISESSVYNYFGNFELQGEFLNATVPFLENAWKRPDGYPISRELLLMALADVKTILVRASYTSITNSASLIGASIDIATPEGFGVQAKHVEQCDCPLEYTGTSCEDCAAGYTRSNSGIYLHDCTKCECSGHSDMCHPDTGICTNCAHNTAGDQCEECKPGYYKDENDNCVQTYNTPSPCACDRKGSEGPCDEYGVCQCKQNVQGDNCDSCRSGTFGFGADEGLGCLSCYCSGVSSQCFEATNYQRTIQAAPMFGTDYGGYTIQNLNADRVINDDFVPIPSSSELLYTFNFPPNDEDLFWSLPVFPGNRVLSYGGTLSLGQKFELGGTSGLSNSGTDVVLVGSDLSVYWSNPEQFVSGSTNNYQVPISENGWFILNTHNRASRSEFMAVLKNLKRVLVRATVAPDLVSTSISDVWMHTAIESSNPSRNAATGLEVCMCPQGYQGTSCEICSPKYYKDQDDKCQQCPCNGHGCQLVDGSIMCSCDPPYVGPDCLYTDDIINHVKSTTRAPPPMSSGIRVIIKNPTINIHEVGSSVNFTCEAYSRRTSRPLRVVWSKINGFLPRGRSQTDERTGLLLITNVQVPDSGQYMCQTNDDVATDQAYTTLTVPSNSVSLPVVRITPNSRVIQHYEGDLIELSCTASGIPAPTISWRRVEVRPLREQSFEGNYIIEQAREEDSGEYRCVASNLGGSSDRTIKVVVRTRPSRPRIAALTVYPKEPSVSVGQATNVICTGSTEVPAGSIEWIRKDGVRFSDNVKTDNGVLYIINAARADEGIYICQSSLVTVPYVTVYLKINPTTPPNPEDRPNVTTSVFNLTIPTGEAGSMDCNPSGYPLPRVKWSKSGGELGTGTSQRDNTLLIYQAQPSDAGYYLCEGFIGDEPVGSVYVYVEIERREKPKVQIRPNGEQAINQGDRYRLQCIVEGYPEPLVSWYKDHQQKSLSSNTNIQPNNILLFESFDVNDEGEYTCSASNPAGSDSGSVYLKVHSLPEITLKPGDKIELVDGGLLLIDCRANGYPRPQVSIESQDGIVLVQPNDDKAVWRVNSVSERDSGYYLCKATSRAGVAEQTVTVDVRPRRGDTDFEESSENNEFNTGNALLGVAGNPTIIKCGPKADINLYDYQARWSRGDRRPLQSNAVQRGNDLIIDPTTKNDEGIYECALYNPQTQEVDLRNITNLMVIYDQPQITLRPPTQTVRPGQTATVECVVYGDNITLVQWQTVDKPFSRRIEVRDNKLIFNNIEIEDAGMYKCYAENNRASADQFAEVIVSDEENPKANLVSIEQPGRAFQTGENLNVICKAASWGVTVTWEKLGTREFISSIQSNEGSVLTLTSVGMTDAATYRCTGRDRSNRTTSEDFILDVIQDSPYPKNDDYRVHSARLTSSVNIPCNLSSDLTEIEWRRPYSQLPAGVRSNGPYLSLERLTEQDAGIYICRATDGQTVQESTAIVLVNGVVPRFDSIGWIALPTMKDSFNQFDIKIAFKPRDDDGLIIYNSQNADILSDYVALQLVRGVPQFILSTGNEETTLSGNQPLQLNVWHTVRIIKKNTEVTMEVDNGQYTSSKSTHPYEMLELHEPLYIGSVPNLDKLPPKLAGTSGFIGCISMLQLAKEDVNIMAETNHKVNVNECDSCIPNPCNSGVCQDSQNENGFVCICTGGFGGQTCNRQGESCQPGLCGKGKCTDLPDGYKCTCPGAYTGRNCESKQSIEYPAFTGSAYLAIDPPTESRFFTMSLKIKAADPVTDGIIMYSAESDNGKGAFISLAVRESRIEFRFSLGDETEPVILTSDGPLPPGELTDVRINRSGALVSLDINNQEYIEKQLESPNKPLYLNTAMYVGGVDESVILNSKVDVTGGFRGCIRDVVLLNTYVDIVRKSFRSENVTQCGIPRGDIPENESVCPCHNGGRCNLDGSCQCPSGFGGQFCQNRNIPDPCLARPCRYSGICRQDNNARLKYVCDCPLGYGGYNCQMTVNFFESVAFNGNGYIAFPGEMLNYNNLNQDAAVIALAIHTSRDGVLVYQNDASVPPNYGDFVLMRIQDGRVIIEWDLGSGKATLTADDIVADGRRHTIVAKLSRGNQVSLMVDGNYKSGNSVGFASVMHANSKIYVGGIPDHLNVNRYPGYVGCISQVELMGMNRGINIGTKAVGGLNAQRCLE